MGNVNPSKKWVKDVLKKASIRLDFSFRKPDRRIVQFWSGLRFILQNVRMKAQSGFRVTINSGEELRANFTLSIYTLSHNSRRQLNT